MIEVAAGVIRDGEGRVLIARRKVDERGEWAALEGLWEFPGGKREPGESYAACLVRELTEELELAVTPGDILLEMDHITAGKPVHLAFVAATARGDAPLVLRVHTEARWVTQKELAQYGFCPADAAFVKRYDWGNPSGVAQQESRQKARIRPV